MQTSRFLHFQRILGLAAALIGLVLYRRWGETWGFWLVASLTAWTRGWMASSHVNGKSCDCLRFSSEGFCSSDGTFWTSEIVRSSSTSCFTLKSPPRILGNSAPPNQPPCVFNASLIGFASSDYCHLFLDAFLFVASGLRLTLQSTRLEVHSWRFCGKCCANLAEVKELAKFDLEMRPCFWGITQHLCIFRPNFLDNTMVSSRSKLYFYRVVLTFLIIQTHIFLPWSSV